MKDTADYKTLPSFGPGSLESITLQLAKVNYYNLISDRPKPFYFRARVTGTYVVYCGMGSDHTVEVKHRVDWSATGTEEYRDMLAAYDGDEDAAHRLAGTLVEWFLEEENWSDPCDGEESMFSDPD